jgi:hypothetical protein
MDVRTDLEYIRLVRWDDAPGGLVKYKPFIAGLGLQNSILFFELQNIFTNLVYRELSWSPYRSASQVHTIHCCTLQASRLFGPAQIILNSLEVICCFLTCLPVVRCERDLLQGPTLGY